MTDETDKSADMAAAGPHTLDARGMKCPLPVLRLRKTALSLPVGAGIDVLADDPAAQTDIPAFCAEMGWSVQGCGTGRWFVKRLT